jgi:hypothetical protein
MRVDIKGIAVGYAYVLFLVGVLCLPSVALGQNCSLCYTQAAAAGARIVQGLRSGIVILVLPPMLISVGLAVMTFRKRNHFNDQ